LVKKGASERNRKQERKRKSDSRYRKGSNGLTERKKIESQGRKQNTRESYVERAGMEEKRRIRR